jgi:hypothetical protein
MEMASCRDKSKFCVPVSMSLMIFHSVYVPQGGHVAVKTLLHHPKPLAACVMLSSWCEPPSSEVNRIRLDLFDMNNRKFGPYLAATQLRGE